MVSPCSRIRSAFTTTSFSSVVPGSRYTVIGNVTLSRGIVCLAYPIIVTSKRQSDTDGTDIANEPFAFVDANFLILLSAPLIIADAPTTGSFISLSMTIPDTLTCAIKETAPIRYNIINNKFLIGNLFQENHIQFAQVHQVRDQAFPMFEPYL